MPTSDVRRPGLRHRARRARQRQHAGRRPTRRADTVSLPLARAVLAGMGAMAAATGTLVAVRGSAGIPGGQPGSASTDSVLRFYAVWWAAQSIPLLRLAADPDLPAGELQRLSGLTFLGGVARLAAVQQSGRPHPLFLALTVVELVVPPVLVRFRRATLARTQSRKGQRSPNESSLAELAHRVVSARFGPSSTLNDTRPK